MQVPGTMSTPVAEIPRKGVLVVRGGSGKDRWTHNRAVSRLPQAVQKAPMPSSPLQVSTKSCGRSLGICPISRGCPSPATPPAYSFLPRMSSTASTQALSLYHCESQPKEGDKETPPKSNTSVMGRRRTALRAGPSRDPPATLGCPGRCPAYVILFLLSISFPQPGKGPWQPPQVDVQAPSSALGWGLQCALVLGV